MSIGVKLILNAIQMLLEGKKQLKSKYAYVWNQSKRHGAFQALEKTYQDENPPKADISTRRKQLRMPAIMRDGRCPPASYPEGEKTPR